MIYLLLISIIALQAILIGLFYLQRRSAKKPTDELDKVLQETNKTGDRIQKFIGDEMQRNRSELSENQKAAREEMSKELHLLSESTGNRLDKVKASVEEKLTSIQTANDKKLEEMRKTVDEKLHETLERRLGESFKLVSERLELVQKGLGEMQSIATGVGDLKKVLNNVKSRGILGETQLGNLLEEILAPEQYEKNVVIKKGSAERVEFAIKLPQGVLLPIDAKFPLEDYQRLVDIEEKGDVELIVQMGKALEARIKSWAKNIKEKYIDPPGTTAFAILFLPFESLYAEVLRRPGLYEQIRQDYGVVIAGPTNTQAILNALQMGFQTLTIQKRSNEVWILLGQIKKEFGRFGDLLEKTHKKLQEASNTIEDATTKTRTIQGKLNKVQGLPPGVEVPVSELIEGVPDSEQTTSQ